MTKKAIFAVILMFLMVGCTAPEEAQEQASAEPEIEVPSPEPSVTVTEDVISPVVEPEPEEEPEPKSLLEDFQSPEQLISATPDIGGVITRAPRKVMLVFNYPITEGTDIKVFDKTGTQRFDNGNTIIANDDSVVTFAYVALRDPGIYMVVYKAVFPSKDGNTESEGYYYFELQ